MTTSPVPGPDHFSADDVSVVHEPLQLRFAARVPDGTEVGYLTYTADQAADGTTVMTTTHTVVPARFGGRGIAKRLARTALEYAVERRWSVDPQCSFVRGYIDKNPEFSSVLR